MSEGQINPLEWRDDMENAPKDYTALILYDPEYDPNYAFEGFFDADVSMGGSGKWTSAESTVRAPVNPTHWMPFPEPPRGRAA